MSFRQARDQAICAIEEGRIQHEARDEIDEKNMLLTGDVTPEQVVRLLKACRGSQYACSPHHLLPDIDVHVFRPEARLGSTSDKQHWYIKLYFLDPDLWFISVHVSKRESKP